MNIVTDTIAAQATPPGRGGIAIVRVSGPQVQQVIQQMIGRSLQPRQATCHVFRDSTGDMLDEGIAVFFPKPHSFTGEDVLELHGHGSPVVVDLVLQSILQLGVRLARPGEFSERAFFNGKIDLPQAEAIADLIHASSQQAARSALRSLQGEFSRDVHALNEKTIKLRTYVEAAIDFTDEDIEFLAKETLLATLQTLLDELAAIQKKAQQGSLLREGITVVISGKPNVGKSSLLNYLSGQELAIVTNLPGTTRDVLRSSILLDGMPLHISDTAGLRTSNDVIEQEGIQRAWQEMEKADMIIHIMDVNEPFPPTESPLFRFQQPILYIRNKIDLINEAPSTKEIHGQTVVSLSVKTGSGIDLLKERIKAYMGYQPTEGVYLARRRHLDALVRTQAHMENSLKQLQQHSASELAAEDLRQAHLALAEITGRFTSDDLLGRIFSGFCIGK